jgi:hypothetical protein
MFQIIFSFIGGIVFLLAILIIIYYSILKSKYGTKHLCDDGKQLYDCAVGSNIRICAAKGIDITKYCKD